MRKLVAVCIERPVFAAMIVLTLVVIGGASYFRLGVDRFPRIDLPQASVRTNLPGAAVEEVETQITEPIEEAVNTVEGISSVRSTSGSGASYVGVVFNLDRDIDVATQDLRDRVSAVVRDLPEETLPPVVLKFNSDGDASISIALSGDLSVRELTEIADKIVKPRLERSSGVGEVQIVGGLERTINIWVDADRLAAYRMPITEIQTALARQNQDAPGGNVTAGATEQLLRTTGRLTDPEAFNDMVIKNVNGAPIRIRDIGRVEDGTKEQRSIARLNGVPTVVLEIRRQIGSNTIEVIDAVKQNLEIVKTEIPPGINDRDRPRPVALHQRGAARDRPAPDPRRHPRLARRLRLHARLALDHHRRPRHPGVGHRHLRHDGGARLHDEQRDDAGAGADGRDRHRQRHRRAREHLPLHRGEAAVGVQRGARGDGGDRAAGLRHHALPRRHLHSRLVRKRMALPNAKILIHQVSSGFQGQATDIEIHAKEIIDIRRRLDEIIAKHTKQDYEKVRTDTERDYFMSSEEAQKYGIIDRVISEH